MPKKTKNKIKSFFIEHKAILFVILIATILRAIYISIPTEIWWDASTYMAMGKYLYSNAESGFYEFSRPILWPLILGIFWKLNISMVWAGRILELLFSILTIWFVYLIGCKTFGKKTGIFAGLILSITPLFFRFTNVEITGIPSTFLGVAAVYFAVLFMENFDNKMLLLSGFFAGLAFLMRFPQGIVVFSILAAMFIYGIIKKNYYSAIINPLLVLIGFIISVIPYLIYNQVLFGSPLFSVLLATEIVSKTHAWSWMYSSLGYGFYFVNLVKDNFLFIFALFGVLFFAAKSLRQRNYFSCQKLLVLMPLVFLLGYYTRMDHKIFRFALTSLPYLSVFAAYGIVEFLDKVISLLPAKSGKSRKSGKKHIDKHIGLKQSIYALLFTLLIVCSVFIALPLIYNSRMLKQNDFLTYFNDKNTEGKGVLISTSSVFAAHIDNKVIPLVYWAGAHDYYKEHYDEAFAIAISSCEFQCSPDNIECITERETFIAMVKNQNSMVYYKNITEPFCEYMIFEKYRNVVIS